MIYISLDEADAMNANRFFKSGKYPLLDWILMIFYSYGGPIKESRIMNESFIIYIDLIINEYHTYLEYNMINGNKMYSENIRDTLDTLTYIRHIKQDIDETLFEHTYNRTNSMLEITELGKEYIKKNYVENNDKLINKIRESVKKIKPLEDSLLLRLTHKHYQKYSLLKIKLIDIFFENGNKYLNIDKNEEAISFYNKILQIDSNNIKAKEQKYKAFKKIRSLEIENVNEKALNLLKSGKIAEFNRLRERKFNELIFDNTVLRDLDLEGANLINVNLRNTDLQNTKLYNTKFESANLARANLARSNLLETSFFRSNLFEANFTNVNVNLPYNSFISYDAGFHADLSESNLNNADFSGAKLSDAIIINPLSYDELVINVETDFSNAIIDDSNFIDYISKYTSKIPQKIDNKKELADQFNRRDFDKKRINLLLQISKLPE